MLRRRRSNIALLLSLGLYIAAQPLAAETTSLFSQPWHIYSGTHFELISDLPEQRAVSLLRKMARFRAAFHTLIPPRKVNPPLKVLVFAKREDFNTALATDTYSGFMQPSLHESTLMLAPDSGGVRLDENALHEYAHYLLRSATTTSYPPWYEEGLASFVATMEFHGDTFTLGLPGKLERKPDTTHMHGKWFVDLTREENKDPPAVTPHLQEMMRSQWFSEWPENRIAEFYTSSWLLVHWLHMRDEGNSLALRKQMNAYLAARSQGQDHDTAFENHFSLTPQELESELQRYAKRLPNARYPLPASESANVQHRPLEPEEIAFELGRASMSLNLDFAHAAFDWLDQTFSKHLLTHHSRAIMQRHLGNHAAAASASDRMLRLDPDNLSAKTLLAYSMVDACHDPGSCRSDWQAATRLFEDVRRVDANHTDALFGLGLTYFQLGLLEQATARLEEAYELAPWAPRVNLFLGEAYRLEGQPEAAREHLQRAVNWEIEILWRERAVHALSLLGG